MFVQRAQRNGSTKTADAKHLVFLDESSVNVDMTRCCGRGKNSWRVADYAPLSTPKSTTVLSSVRLDGSVVLGFSYFENCPNKFGASSSSKLTQVPAAWGDTLSKPGGM